MPWLTRLATVARRTGFPVVEVAGWRTRGHGPQPSVEGVVCHHTAGRDDMHIVRDGRPGLDGPLSQFWLRRDGTIFVVAAGRCWHNAPSTSPHHTNSASLGIEAENNGREAWPVRQLEAYRRLCAELCREYSLPASRVKAHREVNTGKPDPHSIDMGDFRADVAQLLAGRAPALPARLPELRPGATSEHVVTLRKALGAANQTSTVYDPTDPDLLALVEQFKTAHKLGVGPVWTAACWAILNHQEKEKS
ncbi:N-acetylmuramoyl-L-alanine amidase [Nonomuraea sp. NPDC005650]|uniref:peptidoglycan recognition protein family protein n=1 Tax=Nonomuraea sp. NPDC005650 TaxID=3157045 RepID=UPI00339E19DB